MTIVEFLDARLTEEEIRASQAAALRAGLDDPSRQIAWTKVLRALAAVYADHPDDDQAWAGR